MEFLLSVNLVFKPVLVAMHAALVFCHSLSNTCFLPLNSTNNLFRTSRIPCEWNLYCGEEGSTDDWVSINALISFCWGAGMNRMVSWVSEAGFEVSMAWMAFSRDVIALLRSAASASYSTSW